MPRKILVIASTFPTSETDPVPAFVKDQVIALKKAYPELLLSVLAPHNHTSNTKDFTRHEYFDEYRFHYFFPYRFETLAGHGIEPTLKRQPLYYALVPFLMIAETLSLLWLTRTLKPELIYAHWFTPQGIAAGIVSSLTKTPYVYTSHSSDVVFLKKVPLGEQIVRHFNKSAQAITVVSRRSYEKLQSFYANHADEWNEINAKTKIIPMGVDLFASLQHKTDSGEAKIILFVGRLAEKKGVQYLLTAYADVKENLGETKLIVAGDGPWLKRLKNQAAELGLADAVAFPGYVSGDTKRKLIESADIFVVPSIITESGDAEGLPVSLMEGLAYGKVCIATNESGADDILTNGKDGYLVPNKSTKALSEALLVAAHLSSDQQDAISTKAKSTAQQFSWPEIANQHYEFLFKRK